MADVRAMPKNMGKTIKQYLYLPLLDDANVNDQGIDANGSTTAEFTATIKMVPGDVVESANGYSVYWAVGYGSSAAAAQTAAQSDAEDLFKQMGVFDTDYATTKATLVAAPYNWAFSGDGASEAVSYGGNLYGSSKDVGTISGKLPALSETGGRVNRVGFKRVELEGSIEKFGFFDEYTQESLDFDTDAELEMHVTREMVNGANEITEDALQIDLLNSAGVVRYGGDAMSRGEITGNDGDTASELTYEDLMKLSITLDENRCPKMTKIITGSRMIDTKVVDAARYMYIGSELIPTIRAMKDMHDNPAFIPVQHYADAGTIARGEIGTVDQFRIIVVPEMMHWAGAGAAVTANSGGYRETDGNYDVFPMLVVGDSSFTTIGFQTDGKTVKFTITHKKPGLETADRNDPYGEIGFMSIKWYYGFMVLRPERIALCQTVAKW